MIKHGHAFAGKHTPTYNSWEKMRDRCLNPKSRKFRFYGGRGIKVCKEWNSFQKFLLDMGERPSGTTLDRIDSNGNYCKDNCRWSDWETQCLNRRPKCKKDFMEGRSDRIHDLMRMGFFRYEVRDWLGLTAGQVNYALDERPFL